MSPRVAVTGTPGTGKTTATRLLAGDGKDDERLEDEGTGVDAVPSVDHDVVHLNEAIAEHDLAQGHDADRDSVVADLDAVRSYLAEREDVVVESHLAHHVPVDRVVVLRAHPATIEDRLRERGESPSSARENAESEALDVVLGEAVERHGAGAVYEVDTTDLAPAEVAAEIAAVVAGDADPRVGTVSFVDWLEPGAADDQGTPD